MLRKQVPIHFAKELINRGVAIDKFLDDEVA